MPDLKSLVLGREVGEKCSSEVVQRKVGDTSFVGNFNLTFTLPGTLVCLNIIVLRCITTLMYDINYYVYSGKRFWRVSTKLGKWILE